MIGLQPNSKHCFICGLKNPYGLQLRFYQSGPGEVSAETTVPDQFQGYPGVVHGGVTTALLDETLGRVQTGVEPNRSQFLYTAKIEVRFRKNVPVGKPLRLVGKIIRARRNSVTARSSIQNSSGELLAEAEGLLVPVPPETLAEMNLAELGWKIYKEEESEGG